MVRRTSALSLVMMTLWVAFGLLSITSSAQAATCPNEALRTGASAGLPDCRAYELVTPSDSNGRVLSQISEFATGETADLFPTELGDATGESFVYEVTQGALAQPAGGSGAFDVYSAQRGSQGWVTAERLSRTSSDLAWTSPGGVSPDHRYAFSNDHGVDYLRKPDGSFELTAVGALNDEPYAQGRYISASGKHVIFSTGSGTRQSIWCFQKYPALCDVRPLTGDAPPEGTGAVYDREAGGNAHVVSLLPGNETPAAGEQAFYKGTSTEGNSVAFSIGNTLYVRLHNGEPSSEETLKATEGAYAYAGVSSDGRYLFYVQGGDRGTINRLDTTTEEDVEINPANEAEVVNISADGSHAYFICEEEIGGEGQPGQPNLFVWSSGEIRYVATVLPSDLVQTSQLPLGGLTGIPALTRWTTSVTNPRPGKEAELAPGADSSRSTPDGAILVFESRARLTSYDNDGHTEIYRYDDTDETVTCISCNSGAEAQGDARLQQIEVVETAIIHNVSDDGSRVFFETPEALVEEDTNEGNDIYEWEEEGGIPVPPKLISSGKTHEFSSPEVTKESPWNGFNNLLSVTPDGSDVFFLTHEAGALAPGAGENGTQTVYDARVDGGFASPTPPQVCLEEACKPPVKEEAANAGGAASESTAGAGNLKPHKRKSHCHRSQKSEQRAKKHGCSKAGGKKAKARVSSAQSPPTETSHTAGDTAEQANAPISAAAERPRVSSVTSAAPPSATCKPEFGIENWEGSLSTPESGAHPDFATRLEFNRSVIGGVEETCDAAEEVAIHLPPGMLGNPAAAEVCSLGVFTSKEYNCPAGAQVGVTRVKLGTPIGHAILAPVYNLALPQPDEEVARFGFIAFTVPVYIEVKVRTASDYGVTAIVKDPSGLGNVVRATTTLWGDPANPGHDEERWLKAREPFDTCGEKIRECKVPPPGNPSPIPPGQRKSFLTNPSACQQMPLGVEVRSYHAPGKLFTASTGLQSTTDCTSLPFAPSFEAEPTNHTAGANTGLKTKLVLPQHLGEEERSTATMREARVTLPAGMQVAAGAANWIGTCSEEQVGYHEEVDTNCPDSSKLGTATIESPDLPHPIEGTIYQRSPQPGHQLGLWLTSDVLGLHIKLPGELEPDPTTGRLTAVFKDLPQVPVEEIDLNVWGGPRAPLQNPDHCGTFTTDFSFSPHSDDPAVTGQSTMQITEGCNQGFNPSLHAGVTEPVAGKFSPFVFDLTRPDGDQALRGFELKLPKGELANLKGVPLCGDAEAAAASCPASSRIGSLQATSGPGPEPFTIPAPGKTQPQIYLSGPYQGAPFSILSEVPAQAGPFDLGTLAVRSGLDVEPETGIAVVKAGPLPQFFEGVGIAYRNIHAVVDRPEFSLNPTDCSELAVTSDVTSTQGAVAHPQARFQVDGCKALKFKPKLTLKLKGGTKRASYPALTAILKARKGDANIASASVALPHSEFLAQEHIGTICTRVQFAADKCPNGSVYGKAKAWTPLLEKPLSGNVYLRSSNHPLPDLVAKLGGQLEIDLVGRIDSIHGGIRTTFESVPDAPVTKFVLQMPGGKKSLLTNSTNICRGSHRATVRLGAQNGRVADLRPRLVSGGCGNKKLGKHKKHH
jgi:hypothetical protein